MKPAPHAFEPGAERSPSAAAGDTIGLSDLVIIGTGERAKGMNLNRSLLGDVMEALGGGRLSGRRARAARAFVLTAWDELLKSPSAVEAKDAKTFLQEWAPGDAAPP